MAREKDKKTVKKMQDRIGCGVDYLEVRLNVFFDAEALRRLPC